MPDVIYCALFTFQYVSIISATKEGECTSEYYLHSNMFLLFPE